MIGKSPICLAQLGSKWGGCVCRHSDQWERKVTGSIASVQGTYSRRSGYRLVHNLFISLSQSTDLLRRSPFNDSLIASGSDDGKVTSRLWVDVYHLAHWSRLLFGKFPKILPYVQRRARSPRTFRRSQSLLGILGMMALHRCAQYLLTSAYRKVGHVLFNPAAENILATSSGDYTVKLWDIKLGAPRLTLKHTDIVQSLSWSANGSLIATTSRDKKLRIWDVRQEKAAHVVPGHAGAKNSRVTWMGELDRIATTGFSKMSDRQLGLWDIGDPKEPIGGFEILDSISGVCMPFWDDSTQCLYLAGKG